MEAIWQSSSAAHAGVPPPDRGPPVVPDHELLRRIGGGSYGEVWLARCALGQYRAVKIVRRDSFPEDRPFEREFEGIRQFEPISRRFESQVDILHVGRAADYFYYVMELADDANAGSPGAAKAGEEGLGAPVATAIDPASYTPKTLKSELARRGSLPMHECQDIGLALATALQHLHDQGLVHRDVKPSNIIFVGGTPKLADIGLVTSIDATASFVGTEGYIPPEGPGSPQADLYSLGMALYEISTGRPRREFPEPPEDWGRGENRKAWLEFFAVVCKACEPDLKRRYHSAREIRADLALLQSGKSVRHVHLLERRLAGARRASLIAGGLLLLAVAGGSFVVWQREKVLAQARRADQEAGHARKAEQQAREHLWKANLAQAQARRWSGRPGRRFESLAALRQAADVRPSVELRNEAIACLALTDLRVRPEQIAAPYAEAIVLGFDRDYHRYVQGETNGDVTIRRVSDGAELARARGFEPPFFFLGFSPDDRLLAIGAGEGHPRVALWEIEGRRPTLEIAPAECRTIEFSPDSRLVAVSLRSGNCPVQVYDVASGKLLVSFDHHTLPFSLRFHPTQRSLLLTSDETPSVRLWDWTSGRVSRSFVFSNWVAGIAWHPEGRCFAAASGDNNVWLWDTIEDRRRAVLAGHQWAAINVIFSGDGRFLASRGWDGMLYLWDYQTGREVLHTPIAGFIYGFSRAGYSLGCCLEQERCNILEVVPPASYHLLHNTTAAGERSGPCAFSKDGRRLLSTHERSYRLWDVRSGGELGAVLDDGTQKPAAFSPEGNALLIEAGGSVVARPLETGLTGTAGAFHAGQTIAAVSGGRQWSISGDGRKLAFELAGAIHVLDLPAGREQVSFRPRDGAGSCVLNSDGTLAAVWTLESSSVEVWDVIRATAIASLPAYRGSRAAFSPDNRWVAVGDWKEYAVCRLGDWTRVYTIHRDIGGYSGIMAFSPDSRVLAVALTRHNVRLLETATGRELATLEPPDLLDVAAIAFSADGGLLAIPASSGPIQLWDMRLLRTQLAELGLDWDLPPLPRQ
jgi:WD40 repeat protein/serine/threonine protein kinase